MQYNIFHRIKIADKVKITSFNELVIESSLNTLTDTATVSIPLKRLSVTSKSVIMKSDNADDIEIKVGDSITIELEYYRNPDELILLESALQPKRFIGYIKEFEMTEDLLLNIICEDSMYLFKKKKINFSFDEEVTSETFIDYIFTEYGIISGRDQIVKSTFDRLNSNGYVTAARFFEELQKDFKLSTYFRIIDNLPVLYFGLKYSPDVENTISHKFTDTFDRNYYQLIENNLTYINFDKVAELIVVGGTTNKITNKKQKFATIDGINILEKEEDIQTEVKRREVRSDINIKQIDEQTLKDLVLSAWNAHPTSGFEGDITTFGTPLVLQNDIVILKVSDNFGKVIIEHYYVDIPALSYTGSTIMLIRW